jgi:hypothetical protein
MLLAEALALVAIDPGSGRHAIGNRASLNACLAGLLVAELVLDGRTAVLLSMPSRRRLPSRSRPARVGDDGHAPESGRGLARIAAPLAHLTFRSGEPFPRATPEEQP